MDTRIDEQVGETRVGDVPRALALGPSGRYLYVTSEDSATLTVLDTSRLTPLATIKVGAEPYGVVADPRGQLVYVASSASASIEVVEIRARYPLPRSRARASGVLSPALLRAGVIARIPVGPKPKGLALSADGSRLYVTHFLSGEVSVIDTAKRVLLHTISTGSDSNMVQKVAIHPTDGHAYLPHIRSNVTNRFSLFDSTVFPVVSAIDLVSNEPLPRRRIDLSLGEFAVNLPFDLTFSPDGQRLYVVGLGSGDLSIIDLETRMRIGRVDVGEAPRGVVVTPDGRKAYVSNSLTDDMSVVDLATLQEIKRIQVTTSPLAPEVKRGKVLFFSSRSREVAKDRWMSCASCHFEGEHDGRTWLTPQGIRNTTSLRGVGETRPIHWSADRDEVQDFEFTIRELQAGTGLIREGTPNPTLGPNNAGLSEDLDALAAFVESLRTKPSPVGKDDASFAVAVERGRFVFERLDVGCVGCHTPPLYTDSTLNASPFIRHDVGTGDGPDEPLGPASFVQARVKTLVDRNGETLDRGGGHLTDVYQLSTMDPSFEFQFTQDGRHLITLDGSIEDIWGTAWSAGGTYEVYAARPLSLDTAVLPMTSFEVGDVFAPGLLLTPPVAALVDVRFRLLPNSDPGRTIEWRVSGQANRFGNFNPDSAGMPLEFPGEYRVDVTASFRDKQDNLWMGSRTWGGVVAPRNSGIIAHGRRGIDDLPDIGPQWFFRTQTSSIPQSSHVPFPFHSGDVSWQEKQDAALPILTFQDPGGQLISLLRPHNIDAGHDGSRFEERAAAGEIPLFSSGPVQSTVDPHLDPANLDFWGYGYMSVQRPLVRVREEIAEDAIASAYWRFDAQYACQIGMGPNGDLTNDIKFQYGGVVLRGAAIDEPQYAIYGSLFVLVPDDDPAGGTRTFPPFQGNGGGPSGGPIMTLKGREVDLFIHLTGVRPGTILEVGARFALTGAVGSTLPAFVAYAITKPSGQKLTFSERANKIGYYYHPEHNFVVEEPGIYTVDLTVTYDGLTSAGQVTEPFPSGDVLGAADGRFFFYVVPRGSAPLAVDLPEHEFLPPPADLTVTASAPDGWDLNSAHVTTMMPGFLLESREINLSSESFTYRYDPVTLARDFPNLDVESDEEPEAADVISISLFGSGTGADGKPAYAARVLVLHGEELLNPAQEVVLAGPAATVGGIVSSASFVPNAPAAPGSILAVFGQNFGMTNRNFLFPSTEFVDEGVSVLFDGTAAPLFGVFGNTPFPQINVLAPTDLPEMGQVQVEVTNSAGTSDVFMLAMAPASTGIYRADPVGRMYAAALVAFDSDVPNRGPTRHLAIPASTAATLGIPTNCKAAGVAPLADCGEPVSPGVILQIFVTGLGKATPGGDPAGDPLPTGELAPGGYNTVETPVVTIGGIQAIVDFSGLAPSFSGLYQINARVPLGAQAGDKVPLTIRMPSEAEGDTSNIAIAGP